MTDDDRRPHYKYTSVDDGEKKTCRAPPNTSNRQACYDCKAMGGLMQILLLLVAFLAGTTQDSFLLVPKGDNGNCTEDAPQQQDDPAIPLPQDFQLAPLQVAVSETGQTLLLALPSSQRNRQGIYRLSQGVNNTAQWETQLLESHGGWNQVHTLDVVSTDTAMYWADDWLYKVKLDKLEQLGHNGFPRDYDQYSRWYQSVAAPKLARNRDASQWALLSIRPNMTLQLYGWDRQEDGNLELVQEQIPCRAFGDECLDFRDYDDVGSILSYQFMSDDTIAVDMCTMRRCSVHLFQHGGVDWIPRVNFTRPSGGRMIFSKQDDQQKMIQVQWNDYQGLIIRTWSNGDSWEKPWEQAMVAFPTNYTLLPHHSLSIVPTTLLSTDGSVLAIAIVDTYMNRPTVTKELVEVRIFHWQPNQWKLHRTIQLGPEILQVELSGNGQRLILFQKDYSFRVKDI